MDSDQQTTFKKIQDYVYKTSDLLGQGTFSRVYRGHHLKTRQIVAIKVVQLSSLKSSKLEQMLLSQIQVIKNLNHLNILRCFEVLATDRHCYIITQYCNEGDLENLLKKKMRFTQTQSLPLIKDIFKGIQYLSQNNIVHRDLKVANIFIHNGTCKIADFGFARISRVNFKDLSIGSPLYMSPQALLDNLYGEKTDVWAFGILIYELLHGRTPHFFCRNENQLKKQISIQITEKYLHPHISQELKEVIIACLNVDEMKRPTFQALKNFKFFQKLKTNPSIISLKPKKQVFPKLSFQNGKSSQNTDENPVKYYSSYNHQDNGKAKLEMPIDSKIDNCQQSLYIPVQTMKISVEQGQNGLNSPRKWERLSKTNFFPGILTYRECINLLQYCRLMYKYIQLLRDTQENIQDCEDILAFWIFRIINAINHKIDLQEVSFDDNGRRQAKLRQVTNDYEKKYALNIDKPIQLQTDFVSLEGVLRKRLLYMEEKQRKKRTQYYLQIIYFLVILIEATKLLGESWNNANYSGWNKYKRIEKFLCEDRNLLTVDRYSELRSQIW